MQFFPDKISYRPLFNRTRVVYVLHADHDEGESIAAGFSDQGFMTFTADSMELMQRLMRLHSADVVLIDLDHLVSEDRDVIGTLRSMVFGVRVFALTSGHPEAVHIVRAVRSGALSVFVRPYQIAEMVRAVSQELRSDLREERGRTIVGGLSSLSPRELEVLRQVVAGYTNKEIAVTLGISPRTIEVHRSGAMRKLGARNTADMIRLAVAAG